MKFSPLVESENNKLIGGFSTSIDSFSIGNSNLSNNCSAGNCTAKCNNNSKKAHGKNSNCKGNCVKGCGTKH